MNTTALIIQTGLIILIQVGAMAYTIGKLNATINGTKEQVKNVNDSTKRAHKRLDHHVEVFHTKGRKS